LLQLFVVPAVIVACVIGVWFAIESLARSGETDPDAIVRGIRSPNGFQQAKDLADMLQTPERYPELASNRELAQGLADYLDELIDASDDAESAVTMRYFLATVLGEMHVGDSLPVLIKAALKDPERDVRRRAINAIAVLAASLDQNILRQQSAADELVDALVELAEDQDELLRSEAAFAIGVVAADIEADPRLVESLRILADDPYTDARFNAAVGLARTGSPLAAPALAEMLDPEAVAASLAGEKPITEDQTKLALRKQQAHKRNTILSTALSAIEMLLAHGASTSDLEVVQRALSRFIDLAPSIQDPSPLPDELLDAAKRTLAKVQAAQQNVR
jgi:HEAT repeat protein